MKGLRNGCFLLFFLLVNESLWGDEFFSVRILTYNIHNTRGMDSPALNVSRIGKVVRQTECDVAGLQEIDCRTERSKGRDLLTELAQETELVPAFGKAIDFQGGEYGIGILSREKPLNIRRIPLPGREEKRVALLAEYENFFFCCTHWSLHPEDRIESAKILCREMDDLTKPLFLAGDLNAVPASEEINWLRKNSLCISPLENTWPADEPLKTIDYIWAFFPEGILFKITESCVLPENVASDHRPVLAEIQWKIRENTPVIP